MSRKNSGKPRLSWLLKFRHASAGVADVMTMGENKYPDSPEGWKNYPQRETADSLIRHLSALLNGEEIDLESGLPHVDHVSCNAMILADKWHRDQEAAARATAFAAIEGLGWSVDSEGGHLD